MILKVVNALQRTIQRSDRIGWAVLILSPVFLLLVLSLLMGFSLKNVYPVWQDELGFWRTLYSWNEYGFSTGYYGMHEETAALGTMGISGIGPILIYGAFVKLFGLSHNTILLANAAWCTLAAAVFCAMRKPRLSVALMFAAGMTIYAPLVLYCLTSMTHWFDYALVFLFVTFLLEYQEKRRSWMLLACVLTTMLGVLYIPMYCVLFIPVVMIFCRYQFGWRMILASLTALLLSAVCCYFGMQTAAPSSQGFIYHLLRAPDFATFVQMLLSHAKSNLTEYFTRTGGSMMQISFRVMYFGMMALCLAAAFWRTARRSDRRWTMLFGFRPPMLSCFLVLFAAFGFTILLYDVGDWRDYRRLAPYLWLVIAFLINRRRFVLPTISLSACALILLLLIARPEGAFLDENRFREPDSPEALVEVSAALTYDESAEDPFANTIRTDVYSYPLMEVIHPGMGLQYGWFTTETTGKSRWILTDRLKCPVSGYENVLDAEDFKLYRLIEPSKEE